jgi:multidrug efflux system outer membrane protein
MADRRLTALACAVLLAGCNLTPEFRQPEVPVPVGFKQAALELPPEERGSWKLAEPAEDQPRGEWWKVFRDPVLDRLIADANADSPALAAAVARVTQARALLGISKADRIPEVSAGVGFFNSRFAPSSQGLPPDTPMPARTVWRAQASLNYEFDLFGRISSNIAASTKDLAGQEATYRSVVLTLHADIARTYFELRETDRDVALLTEGVRLREAALKLLQARYDAGAIGALDVTRARAELAVTTSELQAARGRRERLETALAVLVGRPPSALDVDVSSAAGHVPAVPPGLPSSLLERRHDIVAAQASLEAANARIGVAKAAFFPRVQLTALGGFEADELGDVFKWNSRTWILGPFFGPLISVPILDGGRNRANLERVRAQYEEAVANYRQRVLVAFGDVEDSLAGLRALAGQSRALSDALEAVRRATGIAQARYDAGAVGYLDVIDAQRTQLDTERQANRVLGAQVQGTVALIRALGGGWGDRRPQDDEPERTAGR